MSGRSRVSSGVLSRLATVSAAALALGLGVAPGLASDASGAPGTVRLGAGEHADFSRVVLNMAPPAGWSTRDVEGGVEIILPGASTGFDDKAVTAQRRAHRVTAAQARTEAGGAVLRLDFGCDCAARVYALRDSMIVVDVRDGAPEAVMRSARPATDDHGTRPTDAGSHANADHPNAAPMAGAGNLAGDQPVAVAHDANPAGHAADETKPVSISAKPDLSPRDEMAAEVARAREMLLHQLKRAADEGFVRFREDPQAAPSDMRTADAPTNRSGQDAMPAKGATHGAPVAAAEASPPAPMAIDHAEPAKTDHGHGEQTRSDDSHASVAPAPAMASNAEMPRDPALRADAGAHGAAAPAPGRADQTAPVAEIAPVDEPDCPDEVVLSPEFWLDERPFHEGLAAHRAGMFDGLNRIDPEAAREMASFYLGHGLGAEAALMTTAFVSDDPALAVLADAGRIIDGIALAKGSPFLRKTPCQGKVALWQAAALSLTDPSAAVQAFRASGRSIARTPEPLRRLLGERIALAAARTGDSEASSAILALLSRNLDAPTDGMRMANAELALREGRIVAAQAEFDSILKGRGVFAVDAAVGLAATLTNPIYAARAAKLGLTLDGIALQNRYGPDEERIVRGLAELRARYGDLRSALASLDDVIGRRAKEPVAAAFGALRMALIATEVETVTTSHELGPNGPKRLVAATEAVRALSGEPHSDALRAQLARHLIDTYAPRVASLVVDAAAAARDDTLAALRVEALEQTALLEKVGVTGSETARNHAPSPAGADDQALRTGDLEIGVGAHGGEETGPAAAADAARRSLRSTALSRYAEGAPPPDALKPHDPGNDHDPESVRQAADPEVTTLKGLFDRQEGEHPPAPTSADEGRNLLNQIDAEINFFKDIADDG